MTNKTFGKVFTLSMEFELGDRKTTKPRLRSAFNAALEAAIKAVDETLLNEVASVTSSMTYDYRLMADEVEVEPNGKNHTDSAE